MQPAELKERETKREREREKDRTGKRLLFIGIYPELTVDLYNLKKLKHEVWQ